MTFKKDWDWFWFWFWVWAGCGVECGGGRGGPWGKVGGRVRSSGASPPLYRSPGPARPHTFLLNISHGKKQPLTQPFKDLTTWHYTKLACTRLKQCLINTMPGWNTFIFICFCLFVCSLYNSSILASVPWLIYDMFCMTCNLQWILHLV